MDLLGILHARIDQLPEGEHVLGMQAVAQHIEVAVRHLGRGQNTDDGTAFTDAIYRTNQAFEGSLKEAYRVLAGKDPAHEKPYKIEDYFQKNSLLRSRVIALLTNYRKEWRNPSTHEYRLEFAEDEALLAIVSVTAFAIVLLDQMVERLYADRAKVEPLAFDPTTSLLEYVVQLIRQFMRNLIGSDGQFAGLREVELIGALEGFLSSAAPALSVKTDVRLDDGATRADLLVGLGDEKLVIEMKRLAGFDAEVVSHALLKVSIAMAVAGARQGIIFNYGRGESAELIRENYAMVGFGEGKVVVLYPKAPQP